MRTRLDLLLVERGLVDTRARAQALIRAGDVFVDGQRHDKPGMTVADSADVLVKAAPAFVGRGGQKLAGALDAFGVDPTGLTCLDVGASTGGFTDCLLQRGAARVYAVDVGRGQLAWPLRQDPRVVSLERTDIRSLTEPPAGGLFHLAVVDVSFISLRQVLPALPGLLVPAAPVLVLVKPQFEVGKGRVAKGGVVRDPELHREVLATLGDWLLAERWTVVDAVPSPIAGGDGNREFMLYLLLPSANDGSSTAHPPSLTVDELVIRAMK